MASPLVGVWELISDDEKAIFICTETHMCVVVERTNSRRGFAGTYTVDGNRIHPSILVDTAIDADPPVQEFQIDGDIMTLTFITAGTVSPVGHVDKFRRIG